MSVKPIIAGELGNEIKLQMRGIEFFDRIKDVLICRRSRTCHRYSEGMPFAGLDSLTVFPPFLKAAQNCHWEAEWSVYTGTKYQLI